MLVVIVGSVGRPLPGRLVYRFGSLLCVQISMVFRLLLSLFRGVSLCLAFLPCVAHLQR